MMPALSTDALPPRVQERVVCSISAAAKYQVPTNIVLAIAEKEGGRQGQWKINRNGTHDVGLMQFNTSYLSDLAHYGITARDVAAAGCYSFDLAAWRLRQHLRKDNGDLWTRVANFHSRTPQYNSVYRADLMRKATKWADWLDARFITYDTVKSSVAHPVVGNGKDANQEAKLYPKKRLVGTVADMHLHGYKASYVPRTLITDKQLVGKP